MSGWVVAIARTQRNKSDAISHSSSIIFLKINELFSRGVME